MACLPASLCRRAKGPWSASSGGHWTRAVPSGEPKEGGGRGYGGGGCDGVAPSEQQPGSGSRRDRAVTYTPPHVPSEPSAGQITAHNAVRSGGKERHAETRSAGCSVVILFEAMAVSPGERRTATPRQILSGTSEPPDAAGAMTESIQFLLSTPLCRGPEMRTDSHRRLLGVEPPSETGLVRLARGLVGTGSGPTDPDHCVFLPNRGRADVGNVVLTSSRRRTGSSALYLSAGSLLEGMGPRLSFAHRVDWVATGCTGLWAGH